MGWGNSLLLPSKLSYDAVFQLQYLITYKMLKPYNSALAFEETNEKPLTLSWIRDCDYQLFPCPPNAPLSDSKEEALQHTLRIYTHHSPKHYTLEKCYLGLQTQEVDLSFWQQIENQKSGLTMIRSLPGKGR